MTKNTFDVGIIGAGISGAFAALKIAQKHKDIKTIIFDIGRPPGKRRRQLEGFLGCFPAGDGKLYPGDLDKVLEVADGRRAGHAYNWVLENLKNACPTMKLVKDPSPNSSINKKFKDNNYIINTNNYYQWKPESIHALSKQMAEVLDCAQNLTFNFDNEVFRIVKRKDGFLISTDSGDVVCKKIIICVGRSGWRWVTNLYKQLGITIDDNYARFGVRVEISGQHMKDFNKSHCTIIKDDLEIGPLSWNGTVIPEDHADLVISTFRSNENRWKSEKVSFSLTKSFYFENAGVHQADRLGKLAFLLFNDRVSKERIKLLLKNDSQLNLLPEYLWLTSSLKELDIFIPNLLNKGFFHVPNIIPNPSKINIKSNLETDIDGMFVAGESAGIQGILAAATMGSICGEGVCK